MALKKGGTLVNDKRLREKRRNKDHPVRDRCEEGEKFGQTTKTSYKINPYFLLHYRIKKKKDCRGMWSRQH